MLKRQVFSGGDRLKMETQCGKDVGQAGAALAAA